MNRVLKRKPGADTRSHARSGRARDNLGWGAILVALLICAAAPRLQANSPEVFATATFAEAQTLATKEGKVIFVDFFTTWCPPCKKLDATTWKDERVIALLREKTIPLRIDAEKEAALAKQYRVQAYPTLLVLKADGTEIDRYVGYLPAAEFCETLTATLGGKTSLQKAREAVEAGGDPSPKARLQLARKLKAAGQYEEALELLLWCYDLGPKADPRVARMLESSVPSQIGALGRVYPPALTALRARRDPLRDKVLADLPSTEIEPVTRLATLDVALEDDESILTTLAKLPEGPARKGYGGMPVLMLLVQKKHYQAALSLGSPEAEYKKLADQTTTALENLRSVGKELPETMLASMRKAPAVIGTIYVVALAGAGETDRARLLGEAVLAQSSDAEVRKMLREGLHQAGANDLAAHFEQIK